MLRHDKKPLKYYNKKEMRNFIKIGCLLILLLALPTSLLAFKESGIGNNLIAKVNPSSPGPGEIVKISLTSYGFDIDTSLINWYVNDLLKVRGVGRKDFTLSLGGAGEQTKIVVYVQSSGGQKATKTFIFDPSEIELLWEAETSKPPFYKGKALPSAGATIKALSIPYLVNQSGKRISSSDLIFTWEKNGVLQTSISGKGKNSAKFETSPDDSQLKVRVRVTNTENNLSIFKEIIIDLVTPEITFYEKKPLEGVNYGQVLPTEYSLFDNEITVRAESYFLPLNAKRSFNYLWFIDQSPAISRPDDPLSITLRQNKDLSGSNRLKFSVQAPGLSFNNSFVVKYGKSLLKP